MDETSRPKRGRPRKKVREPDPFKSRLNLFEPSQIFFLRRGQHPHQKGPPLNVTIELAVDDLIENCSFSASPITNQQIEELASKMVASGGLMEGHNFNSLVRQIWRSISRRK